MKPANDGGPAFPRPRGFDESMGAYPQNGMSLLAWFAGHAVAGLMANPVTDDMDEDDVADSAFQVARSMIEHLEFLMEEGGE